VMSGKPSNTALPAWLPNASFCCERSHHRERCERSHHRERSELPHTARQQQAPLGRTGVRHHGGQDAFARPPMP
jgi:hypothetical protein